MRLFTAVAATLAALVALSAQPAMAAVLFNNSPTDVNDFGDELVNQAEPKRFGPLEIYEQQNILTQITLTSAQTLNGFDTFSRLYGKPAFPINLARPIGTAVTLKIRADVGGRPADTNLFRLLSTITETSAVFPDVTSSHMRLHADFAATTLAAGTYWIGMSGTNTNLSWLYSYTTPRPDQTYTLVGERVNVSLGTTGSSNFRVHGFDAVVAPPAGAVPEPATWALMIGGFGLAGSALRRRRALVA